MLSTKDIFHVACCKDVPGSLARYASSLIAILLALWLRFLLDPYLGNHYAYVTYLIPVILIAWFAGRGPAIFGVTLALLSGKFFFLPPRQSLRIEEVADQLGLLLYASAGVALAFLAAALRQAVRRTEVNEERFRHSERRYRSLAQATSEVVWQADAEGALVELPKTFPGMQYTLEELRGWGWLEAVHPADRQRVIAAWKHAVATHTFYDLEYQVRDKGSEYRFVHVRGVPITDEDGRVREWLGTHTDITQRKQAEERLRRTMERFGLLAEVSSQLLATDEPQEVVRRLCGKVIEQLDCQVFLGYLVDEERGRLHMMASGGFPPAVEKAMEWLDVGVAGCGWVAREGCPLIAENVLSSEDPRTALLRDLGLHAYGCHPLWNQGRVIGTLGFASRTKRVFSEEDVALMKVVADQVAIAVQRTRLLDSLQQRAEEAQAANTAKGQFLANVSHEVRTPMNAILGMTALALEEELSPAVRDCLETVKGSADSLLALLNELLDFSRIESGKLELEMREFHLRALVQETLKVLAIRAQEKGLTLRTEISAEVPDLLVGDSHRIRQVLLNLIGNAVKFTERGYVAVRLQAESAHAEEVRLVFEVADTGIGIAAEHQAHIFDPFTQADASTTRRFGGTGLGLAISARLVSLMGGELAVQSQVGRGSTFRFTVHFARPTEPSSVCPGGEELFAAGLPPPGRPLRVLLAEDTPANQKLVVRILNKRGHTVRVVANGQEAIERLRREAFDVVLMDVQMPVMDGLQATAVIRAWDGERARVPIVAMTAHALKGDEERCLAAGMDSYISKPVDSRELIRLVEGRAAPSPQPPRRPRAAP